jgi:hypothetical protein
MPKTCPNGFICIENMSIILVIIIFLLAFIVYLKFIANRLFAIDTLIIVVVIFGFQLMFQPEALGKNSNKLEY